MATDNPVEEYADKLRGIASVESTETIFPAGPGIFSLSQGKIHFYTNIIPKRRVYLSKLHYFANSDEVDTDDFILSTLPANEYDKSEVEGNVAFYVDEAERKIADSGLYAVRVADTSNSLISKLTKSPIGSTIARDDRLVIRLEQTERASGDGFLQFLSTVQNEFVQKYMIV